MSKDVKLTNSKRRHEKRTYTPLILRPPDGEGYSDALGMAAQVRSLMVTPAEQSQLRQRVTTEGQGAAVDAIGSLSSAVSASGVLAAAASLGSISTSDWQAVAGLLGGLRSDAMDTLTGALRALDGEFTQTPSHPPAATSGPATETPYSRSTPPAATAFALSTKAASDGVPQAARDVALQVPESLSGPTMSALALASATVLRTPLSTASNRMLDLALGPALTARAPAVLTWASRNRTEQVRPILELAQQYAPVTTDPVLQMMDATAQINRLQLIAKLFAESLTQRPLQPLGLLHLERLEMTPCGVERGELSYSLPLAPHEKVTLAHREWSVREEQFSEFIEDFLENFSEEGVAQTDDIALSTSTQTSHNNALSMSQPVAAAPGVHVTSAVDTSSSAAIDDTATREESKAQSRTVTALASTRTMKDHKVSFTVTTVSGMEDFTAHLIENKHGDKSMRIDYFKRVRKWQSSLFRHGVRLTYDVVLPDPGARLRAREVELQNIAGELAGEFQLALTPSQITVFNWEGLADQYGVTLPAPPDQVRHIELSQTVSFPTPAETVTGSDGVKYTSHHRVLTLTVTAPVNYSLTNLNVFTSVQTWNVTDYPGWLNAYAGESINLVNADVNHYCNMDWNLNGSQVPADGQTTVFFRMQVAQSGLLRVTGTYVPTESLMEQWRLAAWNIIRDVAVARAAQHRSYLRDRQAALQKQIAGDDPVRLRRMEREAIMRSVLEWLFPGFQDASSVLANLPPPGYLNAARWQQVMQYGEYIKFVQTAIDWDNVMVFLYPYFWDSLWHESEKIFLDHPDAIHREFLRAGAARVILAIQPGFEEQVVSLLDKGQLGKLPDQGRFQEALDYVKAANEEYAHTTQGGEPDEDPREPGILIGTWTDYTPTSALDIETTVMPVISA